MSKYTKEDIIRIVEEEDIEFIRLQFTDIFGTLKNVAITSSQLEKALDICMITEKKLTITGRDTGCTCEEFGNYVMETLKTL